MAGPGKRNVVKTPDWPATKMTPLRCYENNIFQKLSFTRRAGMRLHVTTKDYSVTPQSGVTRKSVLVAPLCGATHYPALWAIFG